MLADPSARVALPAYAALYDAVVRAHGDEAFGLFAAPLRPGAFEFLCRGTIGAGRLGDALDRAGRFLALVLPELRVSVERNGPTARLVIAEVTRLSRQAACVSVLRILRRTNLVAAEPILQAVPGLCDARPADFEVRWRTDQAGLCHIGRTSTTP